MRIFPKIFLTLHAKLVVASAMTVFVTVLLMFLASSVFFRQFIEGQFESKVRDKAFIVSAEYTRRIQDLKNLAEGLAQDRPVVVLTSLEIGQRLAEYLQANLKQGVVDFISVVDSKGVVMSRAANISSAGDSVMADPFIAEALAKKAAFGGQLVLLESLKQENPSLGGHVFSRSSDGRVLVLKAAVPVYSDLNKELIGLVVVGSVVSDNSSISEALARTVETFAVFQGDTVVITNMTGKDNALIHGEKMPAPQSQRLLQGESFVASTVLGGRSYVVGYTPVLDINGAVIGATSSAISIDELNALKQRALSLLLLIALAGMVFAVVLNVFIAGSVTRPIRELGEKIKVVGAGNLDLRVWTGTNDEVGKLSQTFDQMTENLKKVIASRDELDREIAIRRNAESALRAAQDQLVQAEKMASLGQLSAGVAHEINNPLLFIMGNLSILRNYLDSYKKAIEAGRNFVVLARRDAVESAKRQIEELSGVLNGEELEDVMKDTAPLLDQTLGGLERVKKIVLDLKTFSRAGTDVMEKKDINEVVEGAINICLNELKYKVELIKDYGKIPLLMCDAQKLGQVFINLLLNAAQAIEGKGTIHVETSLENDMVYVKIKDSGKGISKENLKKIFDPFFTTKSKGTGLGLSVSYDIIKRHGGGIVVESEVGRGTVMTIMLPLKVSVVPEA